MIASTFTALVIAILAAIAAYFSWNTNRPVALGCAIVCVIASLFALLFGFISAVALFFRLLPLLLLIAAGFLIYKVLTKDRNLHNQNLR